MLTRDCCDDHYHLHMYFHFTCSILTDLSKHGGSILCSVAGDSPKLVVTGSNCLGARQPYRGGLQLGTVLQTPSQPKDSVVIQIFATEVRERRKRGRVIIVVRI